MSEVNPYRNELNQHRKKDKVKWILTGIAFLLGFVMLAGVCMQLWARDELKPSNWGHKIEQENPDEDNGDDTKVDGTAFVVTPQNVSTAMYTTSYSPIDGYSEIELADNERIIKIDTNYGGDIDIAVDFVGEAISWRAGDNGYWGEPNSLVWYEYQVTHFIRVTEIDSRTYKVTCLRPFGRQIAITASIPDLPDISDSVICDYKQTWDFEDLFIGFNSFLPNGDVGKQPIYGSLLPISLEVGEQNLVSYINYVSNSYTKEVLNDWPKMPDLHFEFVVQDEWVKKFGLDEYKFMTYTGKFANNGLQAGDVSTLIIDNFFDYYWFANCIKGTSIREVDDFARLLASKRVTIEGGDSGIPDFEMGIDAIPAYTLNIYGLPEAEKECCSYDVFFDVYNLFNYVDGLGV